MTLSLSTRVGLPFEPGDPELPPAGFKQSGARRETEKYGVEEYTQIKSTHIELCERSRWVV